MTDHIRRNLTADISGPMPTLTSKLVVEHARVLMRTTKAGCPDGEVDLLALVLQGPAYAHKLERGLNPTNGVLAIGDGRATLFAVCVLLGQLVESKQTNDQRVVGALEGLRALLREQRRRV